MNVLGIWLNRYMSMCDGNPRRDEHPAGVRRLHWLSTRRQQGERYGR